MGRTVRIFEASCGLSASVDAHETSTGTNVKPARNMDKNYPTEEGVLRITARKDREVYIYPREIKGAKGSDSETGRKRMDNKQVKLLALKRMLLYTC